MVMYTLHILSLLIYILVVIISLDCFRYMSQCHNAPWLKFWLAWFLITVTLKSLWFMGLQYNWVVSDHNATIGDMVSFQWLMFDYFNGLANLSIATAVRVYLKWNCTDCSFYKRRRTDRV